MRLLVTKAITSHGRYYAAGETVEMDEPQARSFRSLFGWTVVDETPKPASPPTSGGGGGGRKPSKKRTTKARTKKTD